jgi:hypothetical protein
VIVEEVVTGAITSPTESADLKVTMPKRVVAQPVLGPRPLPETMLAVALALIAYCLILVGWFGSNTPGWVVGAVFIPWAMFMAFLGAYWFRVECKAFRLEDDGTCEFETRWRVMRTHVTQIKSVKESVDDEGDRSWICAFATAACS